MKVRTELLQDIRSREEFEAQRKKRMRARGGFWFGLNGEHRSRFRLGAFYFLLLACAVTLILMILSFFGVGGFKLDLLQFIELLVVALTPGVFLSFCSYSHRRADS